MRRTVSLSIIAAVVASAVVAASAAGTSPPPAATTGKVLRFRGYDVWVSGTVNPRGSDTTVHFVFGEAPGDYSLGSREVDVGDGNDPVSATGFINGLQPKHTFHYRIVAKSEAGTTYGSDRSFTTPPSPVLTKLRVSPHWFKPGPQGGPRAGGGGGATIHFRLSAATTVQFVAAKAEPGRRDGRTCAPASDQNATGERCTFYRIYPRGFLYVARKGKNTFHFSGRLLKKGLPPGNYRLWGRPWGNYKVGRAGFAILP